MERQGNVNSASRIAAQPSLRRWSVGVLAVYGLSMTVAQLLPGGENAPCGWDSHITPPVQNVLHVPAYAGLCVLGLIASAGWGLLGRTLVVGACLAHGAATEWLQATWIPGRFGSWGDMVLNAVGGACGVVLWAVWRHWRARNLAAVGESAA